MIKRPKVLPDLLITLPVILLLSLGVLVIYSSDPRLAIQQIVFALIGLLIYWFLSLVDFQSYNNYTKYLYIGVLALLLIVFIVGIETRGSLRWIQVVGINLQPSELAKPVLILFLAKFWSSSRANWLNIFKSFDFIDDLASYVSRGKYFSGKTCHNGFCIIDFYAGSLDIPTGLSKIENFKLLFPF